MSTLSTQVPPGGTQILEYSTWYCLKYLYLKYFLAVKGLGSPKFPCMSHTPPSVKHVPMLSEAVQRNLGQKDREQGFVYGCWVDTGKTYSITQQMGGSHPTPLGCFPNARGKPVWTSGPYSLAILHFLLFQHITMVYWNHITILHYHISHITSYSL